MSHCAPFPTATAHAGYTLLDKIRSGGNQTQFIIYAGSRAPEHVAELRTHGADGCTNRPDELFKKVLAALASQEPLDVSLQN